MHPDELSSPLGQGKLKKGRTLPVLVSVLWLFGLAVAGWVVFADNPLGGKPVAVESTLPTWQAAAGDGKHQAGHDRQNNFEVLTRAPGVQQVQLPDTKTVTIIDASNGQQQDVIIPMPGLAQPVAR